MQMQPFEQCNSVDKLDYIFAKLLLIQRQQESMMSTLTDLQAAEQSEETSVSALVTAETKTITDLLATSNGQGISQADAEALLARLQAAKAVADAATATAASQDPTQVPPSSPAPTT